MKKLLLLLMAVALCGSANAQKGRSGVGINFGGVGLNNKGEDAPTYGGKSISIGLKYNYGISNTFEVEPWISLLPSTESQNYHYPASSYVSQDFCFKFSSGVNLNTYLLKTRFRPFIITGVSMHVVQWPEYSFQSEDYYQNGTLVYGTAKIYGGEKGSKLSVHGGLGYDYRISYNSYLQLIGDYDTFTKLGVYFGYAYKF